MSEKYKGPTYAQLHKAIGKFIEALGGDVAAISLEVSNENLAGRPCWNGNVTVTMKPIMREFPVLLTLGPYGLNDMAGGDFDE